MTGLTIKTIKPLFRSSWEVVCDQNALQSVSQWAWKDRIWQCVIQHTANVSLYRVVDIEFCLRHQLIWANYKDGVYKHTFEIDWRFSLFELIILSLDNDCWWPASPMSSIQGYLRARESPYLPHSVPQKFSQDAYEPVTMSVWLTIAPFPTGPR